MANQPMKGVRVIEVATWIFTPIAGAVLADWGADVIKVEHHLTGDSQRGLDWPHAGTFYPTMEHANRGKRSIGLALDTPQGLEILHELVRTSDVFLTSLLPSARRHLKIELEDLRAVNPNIIYALGSAFGRRGPEAEKGGYDMGVYWCRSGGAMGVTPSDMERMITQPSGAFGDTVGGQTIAGGIAAALFTRERTGQPSTVDVSLLSAGSWQMGLAVNTALLTGTVDPTPPIHETTQSYSGNFRNPVMGTFRTSDRRWINLCMMQPGRYWADFCKHIDRPDLIDDERFNTVEKLMANAGEGYAIVTEEFSKRTFAEWSERFQTLKGQWAPVQNALEVGHDPQIRANGYVVEVEDADGHKRELLANPVQFDGTPPQLRRAPHFAEHTDEILRELGRSEDQIIQLKMDSVIT